MLLLGTYGRSAAINNNNNNDDLFFIWRKIAFKYMI